MILVLASIVAVFFAGGVFGIFAMVVVGIHAEERRTNRLGSSSAPVAVASRRLLSVHVRDAARK